MPKYELICGLGKIYLRDTEQKLGLYSFDYRNGEFSTELEHNLSIEEIDDAILSSKIPLSRIAAICNNLELLQWSHGDSGQQQLSLIGTRYRNLDPFVTAFFAKAGNDIALKWAHLNGYPVNKTTFEYALLAKDDTAAIRVIEYLAKNTKIALDDTQIYYAVINGSLDLIRYLHGRGIRFTKWAELVACDRKEIVEFLKSVCDK